MKKTLWTVAFVAACFAPAAAFAQILSPQMNAPGASRPAARPPAPPQPTPAPNVRPTQLTGCQDWVVRSQQDVARTAVMVTPGTARSVEGLAQVMWQIRDGIDRGYCLVQRDGRVLSAVQYTSSGTLHYFPTSADAIGGPVQN